jgi:hypothetical protein
MPSRKRFVSLLTAAWDLQGYSHELFQDDNAQKHTAGTVHSWFVERKVNFNMFLGQHNHQI